MNYKSTLGLKTNTPVGRDEHKKLQQVVQTIFDMQDSFEFRNPVDYQSLGLLDYPKIIAHPMDLGTVRNKLLGGKYTFIEECIEEIQLVWDNCKAYNAENSWIHKLAIKLEKKFRSLIRNYLSNINIPQAPISTKQNEIKIQNPTSNKVQKELLKQEKQAQDQERELLKEYESKQQDDIFVEDENPEKQTEQEAVPKNTISHSDKQKLNQAVKFLTPEQLGIIVEIVQKNCPVAFKEVDKNKYQILIDELDFETFQQVNGQIDEIQGNGVEKIQKKVKKQ